MNRMSLRSSNFNTNATPKAFPSAGFWILTSGYFFSTLLENEPKPKEKLTTTR
jgi:hypothetical protein